MSDKPDYSKVDAYQPKNAGKRVILFTGCTFAGFDPKLGEDDVGEQFIHKQPGGGITIHGVAIMPIDHYESLKRDADKWALSLALKQIEGDEKKPNAR